MLDMGEPGRALNDNLSGIDRHGEAAWEGELWHHIRDMCWCSKDKDWQPDNGLGVYGTFWGSSLCPAQTSWAEPRRPSQAGSCAKTGSRAAPSSWAEHGFTLATAVSEPCTWHYGFSGCSNQYIHSTGQAAGKQRIVLAHLSMYVDRLHAGTGRSQP